MQLVIRANSITALAVISASMLMQIAAAVEVTAAPLPADPVGSESGRSVSSASSGVESPHSEALGEELSPANVTASDGDNPSALESQFVPPSQNCFILGSRAFSIPFSVDASGGSPVEVHLFVSRGPDDAWRLLDRRRPGEATKQFQFEAQQDGEFWFATRTIDALGRAHPPGKIESQLKVYVDTTKPRVTMHADADADGRVDLTISVQDATEVKQMRLRYVTDEMKQWAEVDMRQLSADGKLQFLPTEIWKQMSLQLLVTDTPGNQSVVNQLIRRPRLAELEGNRYAAESGRSPTEASTTPFRIDSTKPLTAQTVSNPVIRLDRHQSPAPSNVQVADGYMPQASGTPFHGFGGSSLPLRGAPDGSGHAPAPGQAQLPGQAPPGQSYGPASSPNVGPTNLVQVGQLPPHGVVPGQVVPGQYAAPSTLTASPHVAASPYSTMTQPSVTNPFAAGPSPPADPATGHPMASQPSSSAAEPNNPPASFFDVLFGSSPTYPAPNAPPQPVAPSSQGSFPTSPVTAGTSPLGFGPPSVRGGFNNHRRPVQPQFAGNVSQRLPPPATPEEISNGFTLNSPGQTEPETIPVPTNPEPDNREAAKPALGNAAEAGATGGERQNRPRTPAEAMRPIEEPSQVSSLLQEEIPTPEGQPDPYRTERATPSPTGASDLASMMERAPVRYSDSVRFSLEYELEAVGIRGVETIELYGTTDGGNTWDLWGSDPDRTSPFDIETQEAGVFGFRIVVVGRNGLASPRPQAGESPDIVVVVDMLSPIVRITGARYGEGDRIGSLVIQYECRDENLTPRPISLSFSDSMEGPWTTIVAGLRNEGQYIWSADPNLPRQFYLRIDAVDQAGNSTSYVLDQPIDAQGLAPRARIRGFQSISGGPAASFDGQTAKRPKAIFK